MSKLRPMGAVITVHIPIRKDAIPIDIVAVSTKKHSCTVEVKHSGRVLALVIAGEVSESW